MPLCFVDKFPLNRLTINICQTHPLLQSFCQLWLVILSLNVFSIRVKQQITGLVECCNFGNLKHFASEALFVPFLNGILLSLFELCLPARSLVFWHVYSTAALSVNQVCYTILKISVYYYLFSKCLWMMFLRDRILLSANAEFASRFVVWVSMPLLLQNFLKAPLNSVPLSDHTFKGLVLVIMQPKVSAVSSAPLVHLGWTLSFRDSTTTATRWYLKLFLC